METRELNPVSGQKSFCGKAHTLTFDDGWRFLKSYATIVCGVDPHGGKHRFFAGRSATTGKHVVAFFACNGFDVKGREFFRWDVESIPTEHAEIDTEQ